MRALPMVLLLVACAPPPPVASCIPMTIDVCPCPSGGAGRQRCADDGTHYLACESCPGDDDAAVSDAGPSDAGPTDAGCGGYPCGPYGYTVGRTIEDLRLVGQSDDDGSGVLDTNDPVRAITLAELAARPGVRAIVINVFAEWCAPCRMEQPMLVTMSQTYASDVAFLGVMQQDATYMPPTIRAIDRWSRAYSVAYPLAADPVNALGPYVVEGAYPTTMIVRTRDMQIVWREAGAVTSDLGTQLDALLAAP